MVFKKIKIRWEHWKYFVKSWERYLGLAYEFVFKKKYIKKKEKK